MRACPACGEQRIFEHSVLLDLEVARRSPEEQPPVYARCDRCDALFRRDGPDIFVPQPPDALPQASRVVWVLPPWREASPAASFQLSWDVTEAFFEREAAQLDWLEPLLALIGTLRAAGFDAMLRAGQSLNSLGLSRSQEHGLRSGQSHLFLTPHPDGRVVVNGLIGARQIDFGPQVPTFDGALREAIEALALLDID